MFCESVVVSTVVLEWCSEELTTKWCGQVGREKKRKKRKGYAVGLSFNAVLERIISTKLNAT